ncbi:K+-dependent Na+/Ca+ exchanger family protein [Bacteriovorax sp. BSW11_IV]|uniref:calcium/sodium antiporter n=1 Tax=Bacteriovorax sp. BSW11_IV TaxID=1353529 RepID=UPI000389FDBD|nr:calcium/sodium antiporter [Bacteriovorax sp. BSW11_IV]EQC45188.1 K+-dependent Na+/Ca+ exchanger family protein [Bacteriovorax sp. BSW11_IV]
MTVFAISVVLGLILLVWSADKFVDGASNVARHYGMSPLLIGMVIIGFGTSAPEMVVSALASIQGNPGIAIGNAYGSNITNIALILGITSLIVPISVHSQVLKKELPILFIITVVSIGVLIDLNLSRTDAVILLLIFAGLMVWTIREGLRSSKDTFAKEMDSELKERKVSIKKSYIMLSGGLVLLILSSRLLVYGAVGIAQALGVSDIIVGLTVVAVGTSLPELASSVIAARKGEPDIALGNVLGSNLFNTLAVVGISGVIHPIAIEKEVFYRDIGVMTALTLSLFILGYGFKKQGKINRVEGGILLCSYVAYTIYLITTVTK